MKSPAWMRILLVASLALNLLIIGLVAGAAIRGGPVARQVERSGGFGPFPEALAPTERAEFMDRVRDAAPDFRDNRRALRTAFSGVLEAVRADPFDPAALQAALEVQEAALKGRQRIAVEVVVAQISEMDAEARNAFADRLQDHIRRGGKDGKHREGRPE